MEFLSRVCSSLGRFVLFVFGWNRRIWREFPRTRLPILSEVSESRRFQRLVCIRQTCRTWRLVFSKALPTWTTASRPRRDFWIVPKPRRRAERTLSIEIFSISPTRFQSYPFYLRTFWSARRRLSYTLFLWVLIVRPHYRFVRLICIPIWTLTFCTVRANLSSLNRQSMSRDNCLLFPKLMVSFPTLSPLHLHPRLNLARRLLRTRSCRWFVQRRTGWRFFSSVNLSCIDAPVSNRTPPRMPDASSLRSLILVTFSIIPTVIAPVTQWKTPERKFQALSYLPVRGKFGATPSPQTLQFYLQWKDNTSVLSSLPTRRMSASRVNFGE